MKKVYLMFLLTMLTSLVSINSNAQCCDVSGYTEPGPCLDAVCALDSFCCDVSWDSVCASEAAATEECQDCLCGCYDNDLDGYTNCDGDCDDFDPNISPAADEICDNGIDDDCDGTVDIVPNACDQAGYNTPGACLDVVCAADSFCCDVTWDSVCASEAAATEECQDCICGCYDNDLDGFTNCDGDCDDFDGNINPLATEICNGLDDDCDGTIDEDAVCGTVNVTFSVNMQGLTISPDGVIVALSSNGYSAIVMTDADFDGIYVSTQAVPANTSFNYIFGNGPSFLESVPLACGTDIGFGFVLRALAVGNSNVILDPVCFSSCTNCVPLNDDCDDAIPITCGSSTNGSTVSATLDANAISCSGFTVTSPGVWYTFTGDGSIVELSTCGGTDLSGDTKLHVYEGNCATPICVGADDDSCDNPGGFLSSLAFLSTNGTDYYVLVTEFGTLGSGVDFTLNFSCLPPPANDDCADATAITCGSAVLGSTFGASPDAEAIDCDFDDVTSPGVWYTIEGTGGDIILSTCSGIEGDTKIHVYTGTCSNLICETSNDDDCGFLSAVSFTSTPSTIYFVLVSEYDSGEGIDFVLDATCICDDLDLDGFTTCDGDCDDSNASVNPDASELCNGIDDNCDGNIDEGLIFLTYYTDADGDGYGSTLIGSFCSSPANSSVSDGDCDDADAAINPDATEICNGIDDNCDGSIDEGLIFLTYYADADGDGYGSTLIGSFCSSPANSSVSDGDCDDADFNVNPGATEIDGNGVDDDCDGEVDFPTCCDAPGYSEAGPCLDAVCSADSFCCDVAWDSVCASEAAATEECQECICGCYDNDLDGFTNCDGDCDDFDENINPGVSELCNGIDDNCDGNIDEGLAVLTYYADLDGDGYGSSLLGDFCIAPANSSVSDGDCDDADATINPDAIEVCNGIDDNCDGNIDEGLAVLTYFADLDGDGYGSSLLGDFCVAPANSSVSDGDCDDADATINPDAIEVCNGIDDNCDGNIDEGLAALTYYADADGDGYGSSLLGDFCVAPANSSLIDGDCDDADADVNPGATEIDGNGVDDDCDGEVDFAVCCDAPGYSEAGPCLDAVCASDSFCCDVAWDSVCASEAAATEECQECICGCYDNDLDGFTNCDGDCDDFDENINPGAAELCNGIDDNCDGNIDEGLALTYYADADGDGYGSSLLGDFCIAPANSSVSDGDCDDADATINPDAIEVCNGIDDNCDGNIDEGLALTYYADADGDGYGSSLLGDFCIAPANSSVIDGDCDDSDASINPDAIELCNGIDDNCDGNIDEGLAALTYYADADGDGYGSSLLGDFCVAPANSSLIDGDCDDADADVNPGATEIDGNGVDDDCDGEIDFPSACCDAPGYSEAGACLDAVCASDSFCCDVAWDSVCASEAAATEECQECICGCYDNDLDGFTNCDGDCDDFNENINPDAAEDCENGIDDDCDGLVDIVPGACDQIGYNEPGACLDAVCASDSFCCDVAWDSVCASEAAATEECQECICGCYDNDLDGYTNCDGDCDDFNASINPGAAELCNGIDDNCNGTVDEGATGIVYYSDNDNDGFGSALLGTFCIAPPNSSLNSLDCDDTNSQINPGATELCNGLDDNCDGNADEGLAVISYYADLDGDGFGAALLGDFCSPPANSSVTDGDCDDDNAAVNPDASELCNGVDDDCDGDTDEGLELLTYYADVDADGFGGELLGDFCTQPSGSSLFDGDCDDFDDEIYPGANELCNGIDDDCDGETDEDAGGIEYFADADADGYGSTSLGLFCTQPAGSSAQDGDCDDTNAAINPGAAEVCNDIDDDCDGETDENVVFQDYYLDSDGDGYGSELLGNLCAQPDNASLNGDDCDDSNPNIHPGATEQCNGIDDNCDGNTDEGLLQAYYADSDEDGYGNADEMQMSCDPVAGYVVNDGDCDDTNSSVYPGAIEFCNDIDDDCDGVVDDNCIVSVEENAWNWYVNLYPNPANDQLTIRIDGSQGVFSYSVIDALGKMVYQSTLPVQNQTSTFDCSGLSQGTYTVMISQGNQVVYKKFIKM